MELDPMSVLTDAPIKLVKCQDCGVDVVVNAAYPITEVECRPWYCPHTDKYNNEQEIEAKS